MNCAHCGLVLLRRAGDVNRAAKMGAPLYCGKACAGLARRAPAKTAEQKKEEKRLYDLKYRADNAARLKAEKAAWYASNHDREKEREYRIKRMPRHVEYCRTPEYKAWKTKYDMKRNEQEFADFAEAWRLLQELEKEIRSRASAYEIRVAQGYYTRNAQKRRRELWQINNRKN